MASLIIFLLPLLFGLVTCDVQDKSGIFIGNPLTGIFSTNQQQPVQVGAQPGSINPGYDSGSINTNGAEDGYGDGQSQVNGQAPAINPNPTMRRCVTTNYGCTNGTECCTNACDIFSPTPRCCVPEGRACDFARPNAANNYACCYPLFCAPYKGTEISVCQETQYRYPGQGSSKK